MSHPVNLVHPLQNMPDISNSLFYKPLIFSRFDQLVAGQSTRHGGVSAPPFDSLNLSFNVGDAIENVMENRRRLFHHLGFDESQLASSHQVHDDKILLVEAPGRLDGYDALITNRVGIFLGVSVADCVPVLVFDAKSQSVAAIHAGWKGTAKHIVAKTLHEMQARFGTQAADCFAWIGTCIDECSYEVGEEVAAEFDSAFKRWDAVRQKFFLDLKAANRVQLLDFGIPASQIEVSPFSTFLHYDDYFSHRKSGGKTGRMMGVIGRKC